MPDQWDEKAKRILEELRTGGRSHLRQLSMIAQALREAYALGQCYDERVKALAEACKARRDAYAKYDNMETVALQSLWSPDVAIAERAVYEALAAIKANPELKKALAKAEEVER